MQNSSGRKAVYIPLALNRVLLGLGPSALYERTIT